jgi:hypothetical protein
LIRAHATRAHRQSVKLLSRVRLIARGTSAQTASAKRPLTPTMIKIQRNGWEAGIRAESRREPRGGLKTDESHPRTASPPGRIRRPVRPLSLPLSVSAIVSRCDCQLLPTW